MKYFVKFLPEPHNLGSIGNTIRLNTLLKCDYLSEGRRDREGTFEFFAPEGTQLLNFKPFGGRVVEMNGLTIEGDGKGNATTTVRPGGYIKEEGEFNGYLFCLTRLDQEIASVDFGKQFGNDVDSFYFFEESMLSNFCDTLGLSLKDNLTVNDFLPESQAQIRDLGGMGNLRMLFFRGDVVYVDDIPAVDYKSANYTDDIIKRKFFKLKKFTQNREFRILLLPAILNDKTGLKEILHIKDENKVIPFPRSEFIKHMKDFPSIRI